MAAHNNLGRFGEDIAAHYMEQHGWYIRHRDWRYDRTDIDLVCIDEDDTVLVFVEVKTRTTDEYGKPEDAVDAKKRRNIVKAASAYKRMFRKENREIRYDIISIVGEMPVMDIDNVDNPRLENFTINHIENAFSLMDVYEDAPGLGRKWFYKKKYFGG